MPREATFYDSTNGNLFLSYLALREEGACLRKGMFLLRSPRSFGNGATRQNKILTQESRTTRVFGCAQSHAATFVEKRDKGWARRNGMKMASVPVDRTNPP